MKDSCSGGVRARGQALSKQDQPAPASHVMDSWRKERNQELVRDAYALSTFTRQSRASLASSRQAWLEQRAKYESHVLYEARRQLALLQQDPQTKWTAGSGAPEQPPPIMDPEITEHSSCRSTAMAGDLSPTQPTTGQTNVDHGQRGKPEHLAPATIPRKRPRSDGPNLLNGSAKSGQKQVIQQGTPMSASSAPREHGWDMSKQDLLALPHEDGPHGKIAPETSDPLALTWQTL
ncbi:hypothetical protein BCR44DRAFT_1444776, partial [Catenaria anguillulae PL171]